MENCSVSTFAARDLRINSLVQILSSYKSDIERLKAMEHLLSVTGDMMTPCEKTDLLATFNTDEGRYEAVLVMTRNSTYVLFDDVCDIACKFEGDSMRLRALKYLMEKSDPPAQDEVESMNCFLSCFDECSQDEARKVMLETPLTKWQAVI